MPGRGPARPADRKRAQLKQLRLVIDPIACDGHGLCAELLPERIELDEWGYPILAPDPIGPALEKHARRAVVACPKLALALGDAGKGQRAGRERAPALTRRSSPAAKLDP